MMRGRFTMFTWRFGEVHGWWIAIQNPHILKPLLKHFSKSAASPEMPWNFPIVFSAQQIGDRGA